MLNLGLDPGIELPAGIGGAGFIPGCSKTCRNRKRVCGSKSLVLLLMDVKVLDLGLLYVGLHQRLMCVQGSEVVVLVRGGCLAGPHKATS